MSGGLHLPTFFRKLGNRGRGQLIEVFVLIRTNMVSPASSEALHSGKCDCSIIIHSIIFYNVFRCTFLLFRMWMGVLNEAKPTSSGISDTYDYNSGVSKINIKKSQITLMTINLTAKLHLQFWLL